MKNEYNFDLKKKWRQPTKNSQKTEWKEKLNLLQNYIHSLIRKPFHQTSKHKNIWFVYVLYVHSLLFEHQHGNCIDYNKTSYLISKFIRRCVLRTCYNNENIPFGLLFLFKIIILDSQRAMAKGIAQERETRAFFEKFAYIYLRDFNCIEDWMNNWIWIGL